ncbi:MAG: flagellar filament capping protein FliD [Nitrospirota bacterium]
MASGISFGGLGNGVDFGQVVDQLVRIQRLPIDKLSKTQTTLKTTLTDYETLGAKLLSLQSAADALRLSATFDRSSSSVSDSTVLTASASSTATAGSYTLRVTQLAQAHQLTNKAAKAVSSPSTDIVSGASGTFTFRVGSGSNQTVALSNTATLEDLKTAINDLGAGVSASIVNTGTDTAPAYRLVLTAASTGASNAITIVADSTDMDFLNASGTGGTDVLQAAQDAEIVLGDPGQNPVTLRRSSNTITDAIAGVTLTLIKATGIGTVNVNVTRDTAAVKANIKALVSAYNDIVKFINERNTYDVATKTGGIFFKESTSKTVLSQLRRALSDEVSGLSTYTAVGQIGFKTERDGTITLDETKLDSALSEDYGALKSLFIRQVSTTGVAQRIADAVDALDDVVNGALTLRKQTLTDLIEDLGDEIRRKEDALDAYEQRLRAQYAALDGLLRQLQGQLTFLQS